MCPLTDYHWLAVDPSSRGCLKFYLFQLAGESAWFHPFVQVVIGDVLDDFSGQIGSGRHFVSNFVGYSRSKVEVWWWCELLQRTLWVFRLDIHRRSIPQVIITSISGRSRLYCRWIYLPVNSVRTNSMGCIYSSYLFFSSSPPDQKTILWISVSVCECSYAPIKTSHSDQVVTK